MRKNKSRPWSRAFAEANKKAEGSRIVMLREDKGLSQAELAKRSNISLSTLKVMEKGKGNHRYTTFCSVVFAGLDSDMYRFHQHPMFDIDPSDYQEGNYLETIKRTAMNNTLPE